MWARASTPEVLAQRDYWAGQVRDPDPALGARHPDPTRDTWSSLQVAEVATPVAETGRVLTGLTRETGLHEFLMAALTWAVSDWRRERGRDAAAGTLITLDGHGRLDDVLGTDTTNTVGWFTTAYPVRLPAGPTTAAAGPDEADRAAARALLDSVAGQLAAIPYQGLDYGLLRYVNRVPELCTAPEPQIMFSYLGRLDLAGTTDRPWSLLTGSDIDGLPVAAEPDLPLRFALYVSAHVRGTPDGPQLVTTLLFSDALFTASDIDGLRHCWRRSVTAIACGLA